MLAAACGGSSPTDTAADQDLASPTPVDMAVNRDAAGSSSATTGAPCRTGADCAAKASCVTSMGTGADTLAWPMGYCSAACSVAANDANTGANKVCPGGGTCEADASGDAGHCRATCMQSKDCRSGYSCFAVNDIALGCEPTAQSECDPRVTKSCATYDPGTGMKGPWTCQDAGDGTVGFCEPACDPFTPAGCPGGMDYSDCHVSYLTGEGYCDVANTTPSSAGGDCGSDQDCAAGYGCLASKCWRYCHDDGSTVQAQCGVTGATCARLEMSSVAASSVGICTKSK
jgi:hypothetical protein